MTTILLDAGHGGMKNGVYQTKNKKLYEYTNHDGTIVNEGWLNRLFARELAAELDRLQIPHINVFHEYVDTPLEYRSDAMTALNLVHKDCIALSLHCNAAPKTDDDISAIKGPGREAYGTEIFTWKNPKTGKPSTLSKPVGDYLEEGIKASNPNQKWRGHKHANFHMLREPKCRAVLVEFEFFDNWESYQKLNDVYWRFEMISGICVGLYNYIQS